jgi:hypothetical protein
VCLCSVPGGDCFCLRYLPNDESWRITLTQKTMEIDFCIVFWVMRFHGFDGMQHVRTAYLYLILILRMNISYYVCGKPTQYQCEYLLFRRLIQVFSPMSDISLQHKQVLPESNKLRLRQNRPKLRVRPSGSENYCMYSIMSL